MDFTYFMNNFFILLTTCDLLSFWLDVAFLGRVSRLQLISVPGISRGELTIQFDCTVDVGVIFLSRLH